MKDTFIFGAKLRQVDFDDEGVSITDSGVPQVLTHDFVDLEGVAPGIHGHLRPREVNCCAGM